MLCTSDEYFLWKVDGTNAPLVGQGWVVRQTILQDYMVSNRRVTFLFAGGTGGLRLSRPLIICPGFGADVEAGGGRT